jgi:hypothetical protein
MVGSTVPNLADPYVFEHQVSSIFVDFYEANPSRKNMLGLSGCGFECPYIYCPADDAWLAVGHVF